MSEKFEHPLDKQNAIERAIQLEGPKDPDNFKMPDGRTLTQVRQENEATHKKEFTDESLMLAKTTRESSIKEIQKGENLAMNSTGQILDVTEPKPSEDTITMSTSRTTMADIADAEPEVVDNETVAPSSATTPPVSSSPTSTTMNPSARTTLPPSTDMRTSVEPGSLGTGEKTASDLGNPGGKV